MLDIKAIEKKWQLFWDKEKIYKADLASAKIYSIDTPPPTVSGKMHMGHAFSYAQQDFIARFMRMFHGTIFYPFGTDDNGLPTERLIEKIKKVKSKEMSRKKFIELCQKTIKEIINDFINDWKKLGISCDYDVYYSTIDKHSQKISQKAFIELYKKKFLYQAEFPTLFCIECQTPIAQAELEDKEKQSLFSTIIFSIKNSKEKIKIATTRPELLPACVAIFVHPNDTKYKKFLNKTAIVPLFNYEIPILADNSADPKKGTGAMMICSYGDKFDVDAIKRKRINTRIIFNQNGTLKTIAGKYQNLKILEARKKILEDLKQQNLITKQEKISHVVNVHDKCGTEIEFLTTEQWFIKLLDKKKKFLEQGRKIRWYPAFMRKRYENWIQGLEWDWSVSRDRHFGIPIPFWYCKKCKKIIIPEEKQLPIDPLKDKPTKKCSCGSTSFEPEKNVIDTWATSSLTPEIALSLITKNPKKLLPMSLRPQAHDIIRTWAFYTIVRSLYHHNRIPWKDIVISGFVTLGGEKMSKSKGNIIEPQQIMQTYGADALRFWAASSKLGEDLEYQEKDLITGKKTITKLWNASKFVSLSLKKTKKPKLEIMDEIFLKELNRVIFTTTHRFKEYEYSRAKFNTEEFFWKDFCDYYLEIIKKRVYQGNKKEKLSAQYTLYNSLLTILKLFAPIMPFITEELYQQYFRKHEKKKSIHLCDWPKFDKKKLEKWSNKKLFPFANEWFKIKDIISKVRKEKAKNNKSMKAEIILTLESKDIKELKPFLEDLKAVTAAKEIKTGKFSIKFL